MGLDEGPQPSPGSPSHCASEGYGCPKGEACGQGDGHGRADGQQIASYRLLPRTLQIRPGQKRLLAVIMA